MQAQHCSVAGAYLRDEEVKGTPLAEDRFSSKALGAAYESQHPIFLLRVQPQGVEQAQCMARRLHRCEGLAKVLGFLQAKECLTLDANRDSMKVDAPPGVQLSVE